MAKQDVPHFVPDDKLQFIDIHDLEHGFVKHYDLGGSKSERVGIHLAAGDNEYIYRFAPQSLPAIPHYLSQLIQTLIHPRRTIDGNTDSLLHECAVMLLVGHIAEHDQNRQKYRRDTDGQPGGQNQYSRYKKQRDEKYWRF